MLSYHFISSEKSASLLLDFMEECHSFPALETLVEKYSQKYKEGLVEINKENDIETAPEDMVYCPRRKMRRPLEEVLKEDKEAAASPQEFFFTFPPLAPLADAESVASSEDLLQGVVEAATGGVHEGALEGAHERNIFNNDFNENNYCDHTYYMMKDPVEKHDAEYDDDDKFLEALLKN